MERSRILVVENERIVALDISDRLKSAGYEILPTVSTGEAAIECCRTERPPQLLLMDIRLDGVLDGIDTASRLREIGHFPVIFLTAYSDEQSILRAKAVDPYGYILKPVQDQDLLITVEMALARAVLERKLIRQEQRLERIVDNLDTAVAMVSVEGRITVCNAAFVDLTGHALTDECRGKLFDEVVELSEFSAGTDGGVRASLRTPAGESLPVEYSESDLGEEGRVISLTDIRVREEYERELVRAAREADENARSRARFLSNVSHELRTPLNSIMGMTDLALELAGNTAQKEYLGIVRESSQTLLRLVSSILHYTQVESRSEAAESVRVDLLLFCEEVVEAISSLSSDCSVRVGLRLAGLLPRFVYLDRRCVRQILLSLGGNAVKFTGKGNVILSVETDESRAHVLFRVQDEGPGIPEHERSRIFEPFVQLREDQRRNEGGSGIGLSVARSLADQIGARIDVRSTNGAGSELAVSVPIEVDEGAALVDGLPGKGGFSSAVIHSSDAKFKDCIRSICDLGGLHLTDGSQTGFDSECDIHVLDGPGNFRSYLESGANSRRETVIVVVDGRSESDNALALVPDELRESVSVVQTPLLPTTFYGLLAGYDIRETPQSSEARSTADRRAESEFETEACESTPAERPSDDSGIRESSVIPDTSPMPRRILLAEDEAVNRLVNRRVLERLGHEVETAANGNECIELLAESQFDLVFMDLRMPGLNGLEAVSRIRSGVVPGVEGIPIVALTAYALESERAECMAVGMDGFLGKPFSVVDLYNAVERYAAGPMHYEDRKTSEIDETSLRGEDAETAAETVRVLQMIRSEVDSDRLKRLAVDISAERRRHFVREDASELLFRLTLACRRGDSSVAHDLAEELLNMAKEGEL